MKFRFKKDKFKKSRGGYSRCLSLSCEHCGAAVCKYQKDGSGPLKRLYADRITPEVVWADGKKLLCVKCKRWLGIGSIYRKENRKCFILFQGVITKKIVRL